MRKYSKVVIDFFSGLDGWTQAFNDDWLIISVELNEKLDVQKRDNQIILHRDIMDPELESEIWDILLKHGFRWVDLILASPPCQAFSIASCSTHWTPPPIRLPKTEKAKKAVLMVKHTLALIEAFSPSIWFIENPRGLLRKMPFMDNSNRVTIWLCKYGDIRGKPTDLWTNAIDNDWIPEPVCKNYKYDKNTGEIIDRHCHHEGARRGAKTGTQGLKGNALRSKLPYNLSKSVNDLMRCEK